MITFTQLIEAARLNRRQVFRGVPDQWLGPYLEFHLKQGTLAHTAQAGVVTGIACGWQCFAAEILDTPDFRFHWQSTNPYGDAFHVAQCLATTPQALRGLIAFYHQTYRAPTGAPLRIFATRHGQPVEYPPRFLRRLYQATLKPH